MLRYLLSAFILLLFYSADAQQVPVRFVLVTAKGAPVAFATVGVAPTGDSTALQQKVSDSSGTVLFHLAGEAQYRVRVTSVDYSPLEKGIALKSAGATFTLTLEEVAKSLATVVIKAQRPLMRQEDDKTIVDPENLAASSTNAYEILEKTPGLFVDQDGNIYINSTTPATIYINGREQKLSTADIATMLKSLPPGSIASIEILRTPSARYDASGAGGIVNVVLKKGVRIGLTGSVNAGFNQGQYGNRFVGFNLNNSNGALTSYINMQFSRRTTEEQIKTDRLYAPDSVLSQDSRTLYPTDSYYLGYGLGYALSRKWELNYDGRVGWNSSRNSSTNSSIISQVSTGDIAESNYAQVRNRGNVFNLFQGLSARYRIDSLGSEWTTDLAFTYTPNTTDQVFVTDYNDPFPATEGGTGDLDNNYQYLSAQTNGLKKLKTGYTLEAGVKSTFVWFSNQTTYTRQVAGSVPPDNFRSRSYNYTENINSAFVQASKSIRSIVVKVGTRVENTNMRGHQQTPGDTSFLTRRTDFFPYVYISRKVMEIAGYELKAYLVFRKSITRPAYEYLNPSPRYIDPYLFEVGNPALRPQFTKNYEANISVDERPIVAIGYNDTRDIFTTVMYQVDSSLKQAYRTYDNLGSNREIYFRGLGAIPPGKRYFFVVGLQYNRNFYQGLYESKPLSFKRGSYTIFTYQTFKITPLTQLTVNGFARFRGQLQFYELSTFGALNVSLSQQLLQKKLTITLSGNDILATNQNEFTIEQGTLNAKGVRKGDTRRFGVNLRYNFGLKKREETKLFNVESPERTN
jgi:iron complex outermembrane recepter protein